MYLLVARNSKDARLGSVHVKDTGKAAIGITMDGKIDVECPDADCPANLTVNRANCPRCGMGASGGPARRAKLPPV
jgi:hypothetical protein